MDMTHFVYSSVDGHLNCHHLLITMNYTSINICVEVYNCGHVFSVLLGAYLGVEFLGYMVTLYVTF